MARRSNTKAAEATESTEVEATEETTTETAPKAEEKPVDLSGFQSAVAEALSEADTSTGDLPATSITAVNNVYRELDGIKAKNAARSWIDEQMRLAISEEKDIAKAKAFVMLKDGLNAGSASSTKTPADPTQAFVQKVAALSMAFTLTSSTVPEGVSEDWSEKVEALVTELGDEADKYNAWLTSTDENKGDAPEVSPVVRAAFKMASGKASGTSSRVAGGPRRDTEKHITQVFEGLAPGSFLTTNEIAKAQSAEYGDDRPSAGAISARLFPKGKEPYASETVKAVVEEGKSRGAVRL